MLIYKDGSTAPIEWTVWFHVVVGITWIGLLYYFNFVQVPAVATALSEADSGGPGAAAINKYVAPRALLWFRWAALLTWLSGAAA
ncbi:MAG: urate hydroxylase PuuD, partial [Gammaproteobacteria bacterium]